MGCSTLRTKSMSHHLLLTMIHPNSRIFRLSDSTKLVWLRDIAWTTPHLNGSTTGRDESLHRRGVISSGKLLLLRLPPLHHWDCHQLLVHSGIQIQDLQHLHIYQAPQQLCPYSIICKNNPKINIWGIKCGMLLCSTLYMLPLQQLPLWWQKLYVPPATGTLWSSGRAEDAWTPISGRWKRIIDHK